MQTSCLCTSIDCVAGWYGSQAANNTFTLLGAIATASATGVALYLSQKQSRELSVERRERARLAALSVAPTISRTLERILWLSSRLEFDTDAQTAHGFYSNALGAVMANLRDPVETISVDVAASLAPLREGVGEKLALGFAAFELAHNSAVKLHPYAISQSGLDHVNPPAEVVGMRALLDSAIKQMTEALAILSRPA